MARLNSVSSFFDYKVAKGFRSKSNLISDRAGSAEPHRALLDSCVQIEEIQIDRSTSIPHQINFRLDLATLEYLEAIELDRRRLRLSPTKIANLRCYVLHNAFVDQLVTNSKSQSSSSRPRSPLTFSTHYASANQQSTILLRSAIDLKGKVWQQVQRDLYQNPQMLARISQVHYWLISELIAQLPLKSHKSSWLVFSYSFVVAVLLGWLGWYLFPFNKLLYLIIAFSVFYIFNTCFKKTIAELTKRWLIYYLVEGFLAKSVIKRQIGLKFLSLLL